MQRIINALVQFRNPILYLFLMGVSLFFLSSRSSFHQNKLEKFSLYFSSSLYNFSNSIDQYFNLKEKNQLLIEENSRLKSIALKANAPFLYDSFMGKSKRFPFKIINANIIKNSFLNQRNYILIDKGSEDGIQPETGVITSNGILGIVKSVTKNHASIISILHQDLKINVRFKNRTAFGSMVWKGLDPMEFNIDDIVSSSHIQLGDTIVTGGMSSFFPYGIPLGTITELDKDSDSGYFIVTAKLFQNPSQIYNAYVIENNFKEEIELLNKEEGQ